MINQWSIFTTFTLSGQCTQYNSVELFTGSDWSATLIPSCIIGIVDIYVTAAGNVKWNDRMAEAICYPATAHFMVLFRVCNLTYWMYVMRVVFISSLIKWHSMEHYNLYAVFDRIQEYPNISIQARRHVCSGHLIPNSWVYTIVNAQRSPELVHFPNIVDKDP